MTLALYGKSNRRRLLLAIAALMAVMIAMAGGAVLRYSDSAKAATSTIAPSAANCTDSSGTIGTCAATSTTVASVDALKAVVRTDDVATGGTGRDDLAVTFTVPTLASSTINSVTISVTSAQDPVGVVGLVRVGSTQGGSQYGSIAPGSAVAYTGATLKTDASALLGNDFQVFLSVDCTPNSNECGASIDKVEMTIDYTALPDLTVTKSNSVGGSVAQDGTFNWTFHIANAGVAPAAFATGATILTDGLPAGAVYTTPATPTLTGTGAVTCSITGATGTKVLTCTANGAVNLPAGTGAIDITLPVDLDVAASGTITNPRASTACAVSAPSGGEFAAANNSCSNSVTIIPPMPDLTVTKTNSVAGTIAQGGAFNWVLVISNTGTGPATFTNGQEILKDNSPNTGGTGPTYGTAVVTSSGLQGSGSVSCATGAPNLTCTSTGGGSTTVIIPVGATITVTIPVTNAGTGTSLVNPRGGVSSFCAVDRLAVVVEIDDTNNACADTVTVVPPGPNLVVTKSDDTSHAGSSGTTFHWILAVRNTGTGLASYGNGQTILTDQLPTTLTYGSPTKVDQGVGSGDLGDISCSIASSTLTCTASANNTDINGGEGFDVSIPVTNPAVGTYDNPKAGGTCKVDPTGASGVIAETNENDNNCNSDTVVVATPDDRTLCHTGTFQKCLDLLHTNTTQVPPANACFGIDADFVIDTSGSIGGTNIGNLKTGLGSFVDTLGSTSKYSAVRFSGDTSTLTSGYVDGATFKTGISGISSDGRTWTKGGIALGQGNTANGDGGRPDVLFIATDGNPNVTIGGTEDDTDDPLTWLDAANAAIDQANAARGSFWVRAVMLGTGDTSMPASFNQALWTSTVMTRLGGGSYVAAPDWTQIAQGLLASTGCEPTITKSHTPAGNVAAGGAFTWTITVVVPSELGQATTVTDTAPAGMTFGVITKGVSGGAVAGDMTCNASGNISCTLAQHAHAGTYTINVAVTAPPASDEANCKLYTNTATSKYGSLDLPNAADPITVTTCNATDLTIVKTHSAADVTLGQGAASTFVWTLTANNATGTASFTTGQIILTDTLPTGATYILNTTVPSVTGGTPTGTGGATCALNTGTRVLTCNAGPSGATLKPGSSLALNVAVTPTVAGDLVNSATACKVDPGALVSEQDETNNTCSDTVHVHDPSPITVVKAAVGLSGNTATWTITIDNTGTFAIQHSVVVTDTGATWGGAIVTGGHGSTCSPSSLPTTCTAKSGDKIVITVTKDASSIAATCTGGTISNQASYTLDGGSPTSTANPAITVPGTPGACDRIVTICKQITQNNDGIADDLAALTLGVAGNTKSATNSVVLGAISEGGSSVCGTITVLQKDTLTITEPTGAPLGTGWTLSDITGADTKNVAARSSTLASGTSSPTVTFINVHTFQTRTINVCKAFEANTDGLTDTFTFVAHVVENGTNVTHGPTDATFTNVAEGQSPCQAVTVALGAAVAITEPNLPGSWGASVAGYPKVDIGEKPDGSVDTSYWTVRNNETDRTRSVNLCKFLNFVDDGTDEGGTFTFNLTWSGGGSTSTTRDVTESSSPTAVCADVTGLPQGFDITITETDSRPANWGGDEANFPTNNASGGNGHKVGIVTAGATTPTVTFTNQPLLQTRNISVCKNVLANADGTNDGGTFSFTVQWPTLPSGTHSDTITRTAFENSGIGSQVTTDCGGTLGVKVSIAVPKGKVVTVAEGSARPATWSTTSDDAANFPKAKHGADASYSAGALASLTSPANGVDDELDFQNSHVFRSRSIQVCKAVLATDDGIESGGDFVFSITWNTGSANDVTLNVLEGGSKCTTVAALPAGYDITVAEKTKPAGWIDFDATYPRVAVDAAAATTGSSAVLSASSASHTVTLTNKPTFQTRDLFICKNVLNNADGLEDGGAFGFSLSWTGGSGVATRTAFEHTSVSPSHVTTDCGGDGGIPLAIKVPKGKDVQFTETSSAWGASDAAGFPRTGLGNPPGSLAAGTSIVSAANAVGDTAYFQNKRADRTRTITICKAVDANLDGVNDGGGFGFVIKDDADQVIGGTQTRNAWESAGDNRATSDCGTPISVVQGKSYTVSENSEPAGWQDDATLGYPKNDAAATNTFVTGTFGTVPSGNGNVTVTFKNRTLDKHMDVNVCKLVAANNDNINDGGDFQFKLTQAGASDQTFTITNTEANAGGSDDGICATRSILSGVPWTISELAGRPGDAGLNGTWNGDDPDYPSIAQGSPGRHTSISLSGQVDRITFVNKTLDRVRVLSVCKTVAGNGDGDSTDGGTFHFVASGGSPSPASFDLTVDEGADAGKCARVTVLDGFTQTVTETEPSGWIDASGFPQWAILDSGNAKLSSGTGLTSGTAGADASSVVFTNEARPTQAVTFIKAVCTAFEQIPSNNPSNGIYTPNDLPGGYTQADLGAESPAAGVAVGSTLPAGCTSVAGWTFNLFTFSGTPLGSVTTDANGKTLLLDDAQTAALIAGGINVKEQTQAGYSFGALKCYTDHQLLDNSDNIVLPNAASTATAGVNCVAYNVATGSISGTKWEDTNGNGTKDAGDLGLSGWTITATRSGGAPVFTTTTGANGIYSFTDLPQGAYNVCETPQPGWTNTAPVCVEVTIGGGSDANGVDFFNFADAHIINVKVVTNNAADTTNFTADITGPKAFTSAAFHQGAPGDDVVKTAGAYTATEDTAAGFRYVGTSVGQFGDDKALCPSQKPDTASIDGATTNVTSGATIVFCHYNVEVGTVLLIKNETHQSAAAETWNFTSSVLGNPALNTAANGQNPPAVSSAQTTLENVPVGSYSIAETQGHNVCLAGSASTDYQTNALAAVDSVPNPDPAANVIGANNLSFSVQKGKQTTIVFENQGCGTVLATSSLAVKKFADPEGNFSGATPLQGWLFTVTGTTNLGAALLRTASTDGSGVAFFPDLPDGSYTVTETLQSGWQVVGSKFVIGGSGTLAGAGRAFTLGLEENKEIDFYNQPLVSITVTKIEVSASGTHGGEGWLITISGCGHTDTQPTGANGTVTFANLLPCIYTVTERVDSKPGFAPVGLTTVKANATTPGANVRIGFENVKNEVCTNCNTVPTPTPSPTTTPVPPTATPTTPVQPTTKPSDPAPTATPIDVTLGEKTPGPGRTPIAPNTGNGLFGTSDGSTNILLALFGVFALGAGLVALTATRRKQ